MNARYLNQSILTDKLVIFPLIFKISNSQKHSSVSLSHNNVYCCLICSKYFQGRGKGTHAYLHALDCKHYVYLNLHNAKFYCLPDNYEIVDPSLDDILYQLNPMFTQEDLKELHYYEEVMTKKLVAFRRSPFLDKRKNASKISDRRFKILDRLDWNEQHQAQRLHQRRDSRTCASSKIQRSLFGQNFCWKQTNKRQNHAQKTW